MINIQETKDATLNSIFNNRWKSSQSLWDSIKKDYTNNKKVWSNQPEWLARVPNRRSRARDNRIFMAVESQINKITARPVQPLILPANGSDEAIEIADSLQKIFLDAYRTRAVKKNFKRGLRYMHFAKLFCLKVFWNNKIDDYDVRVVDPRKIRFSKNATNEQESEFAIEEIDDKNILQLIELFPEKEDKILAKQGISKIEAETNNPTVEYHEVWIGDGVFWRFKGEILSKIQNPYYDFDGLLLTPEETASLKEVQDGEERLPRVSGRRRRQMFAKFKAAQEGRGVEGDDKQYERYLYNHHDEPRKPFIFGTILEVEDSPVGEVTLIEMVIPLQERVDQGKRQIADNADTLNGITKVDTDLVDMELDDARAMHHDPEGLVFGPGVSSGVTRETGQALPQIVFDDLVDSRNEIDEIMGTTATLRGSGSDNEKTATGRAILREEGISRLDEVLSLVDYMGEELYSWWFQMIKVKYTESHLVKSLGTDKAEEVIDIMQDDLEEGIEIRIKPGQTVPDDKLFRAERAREDVKDGFVDPITYVGIAGGYENPEEIVKRATLYAANPFNIIALDDDDKQKIEEGHQERALVTPQQAEEEEKPPSVSLSYKDAPEDVRRSIEEAAGLPPSQKGGTGEDSGQAVKAAETRAQLEQIVQSPEFQALEPEQQQSVLQQVRDSLEQTGEVDLNSILSQ